MLEGSREAEFHRRAGRRPRRRVRDNSRWKLGAGEPKDSLAARNRDGRRRDDE